MRIEDLKVGDELECIDRDGYIYQENGSVGIRENILDDEIIIKNIDKFGAEITQKGLQIPLASLKYFKKKEQQQHTFHNLVDVAVQAKKDKLMGQLVIHDDAIYFKANGLDHAFYDQGNNNEGIERIKALYKERFTIESEADIKRIKGGAKITFSNGFSTVCSQYDDNHIAIMKSDKSFVWLNIDFLKGATVEQEVSCE